MVLGCGGFWVLFLGSPAFLVGGSRSFSWAARAAQRSWREAQRLPKFWVPAGCTACAEPLEWFCCLAVQRALAARPCLVPLPSSARGTAVGQDGSLRGWGPRAQGCLLPGLHFAPLLPLESHNLVPFMAPHEWAISGPRLCPSHPGLVQEWTEAGGAVGYSHVGLTAAHQVPPCSAAEPAGPATTPDWTQSHSWGSRPTACGCEGLGHAEGQGALGERWDTGAQRAWRTRGEPGGRGEHSGTWRGTEGTAGTRRRGTDRHRCPPPVEGRPLAAAAALLPAPTRVPCPPPHVAAEPPGLTGSLTKGQRTGPEPGCRFQPELPSRAGGCGLCPPHSGPGRLLREPRPEPWGGSCRAPSTPAWAVGGLRPLQVLAMPHPRCGLQQGGCSTPLHPWVPQSPLGLEPCAGSSFPSRNDENFNPHRSAAR